MNTPRSGVSAFPSTFTSIFLGLLLLAVVPAKGQVIFSEGFEGSFPTGWTVGDSDALGTAAYWGRVDENTFGTPFAHGGSFSGYCAGVGFGGAPLSPTYRDYMEAFMSRSVDFTGLGNAVLTFYFNIPSLDEGYDWLSVYVDDTELWYSDTTTVGWQQQSISILTNGTHTVSFVFFSDLSDTAEGAYLDDITLSANGAGPKGNLTPYQPAGWSDKIVISKTTGTHGNDVALTPSDTLYLDWAVVNNGAAGATGVISTELYVDNVLKTSWVNNGVLPANMYLVIEDYNLGTLAAGSHSIKIKTDAANAISESNETDNEYTTVINVTGTADIRISPLTLNFNVTNTGVLSAQSISVTPVPSDTEPEIVLTPDQKIFAATDVTGQFEKGATEVEVIVNLAAPSGRPQGTEWDDKPKLKRWQATVKGRQDEVLNRLDAKEFKLRHRFENQEGFSGTVTRAGFEKLARHPRVKSIEHSRVIQPHMAQGIPLINGMLYRSTYNGSGVSIAIVDSGVDYTHARLGGGSFPNAKVIGGYDFGDGDANPMPTGDAHGTACAGIAAGGLGTVGDYIGGVAPNAKIYALKVTKGAGSSATDADIIAAWNWCITHKNDDPANPLLVVSTSFGGDRYYATCDVQQSAYATAANNLVAAGLTVLVSSGNDGYCDSISSPACISSVLSVGAVFDAAYGSVGYCVNAASCAPKSVDPSCLSGYGTTDTTAADKVTRYSSTASFLTLLAPSHKTYTTDIVGSGGYSSGDYEQNFGGTSAACPYAAGAVAALQSAARSVFGRFLAPAEVRSILTATGDAVTDTKAAITKPRVNLGKAIESLGQNNSFTIFNDGNAGLNVTSMTLDNAASWINWTPSAPFTVGPGSAQIISVSVNPSAAPIGLSTRRLIVSSDDLDESPYPGGVFINVTNIDGRVQLTGTRSGTNVVFSWPTNATGYTLQWADSLPATNWSAAGAPVVVGGANYVTNAATASKRFYRLQK